MITKEQLFKAAEVKGWNVETGSTVNNGVRVDQIGVQIRRNGVYYWFETLEEGAEDLFDRYTYSVGTGRKERSSGRFMDLEEKIEQIWLDHLAEAQEEIEEVIEEVIEVEPTVKTDMNFTKEQRVFLEETFGKKTEIKGIVKTFDTLEEYAQSKELRNVFAGYENNIDRHVRIYSKFKFIAVHVTEDGDCYEMYWYKGCQLMHKASIHTSISDSGVCRACIITDSALIIQHETYYKFCPQNIEIWAERNAILYS